MEILAKLKQRDNFLTTREVMYLLQLRRNTLCDWVRTGRIAAVRTPCGYRFDPGVLADWLAARSIGTDREAA